MWKIQFAKDEDSLFIRQLSNVAFSELIQYFRTVTETFDTLNGSVMCTSVIYEIKSYSISNQNLFINYHIDSDDKVIRITSLDIT